jgi:glutathione synthase/RimK-type ligase-like ATP-grasp enzyme
MSLQPQFCILDERDVWHAAAIAAARRAGYRPRRIFHGDEATGPGVGFIRPHADWRRLPGNRLDFAMMARRLTMIQDRQQVEVYEHKSAQFARWARWMPDTWRFTDADAAQQFAAGAAYPLVSKADVGASSTNVRILRTPAQAQAHLAQIFGPGVPVCHGAHCPRTLQRGYALLQRFIPHKVTYRVNAIGRARAVFFRYCYPDRPVAQTGNVEPAFEMTDELESLLAYADRFVAHAGTQWCALDILRDGNGWRLLETSLAWPWPSPGRCNEGTLFRARPGRKWIDMFDVMFEEVAAGAWGPVAGVTA